MRDRYLGLLSYCAGSILALSLAGCGGGGSSPMPGGGGSTPTPTPGPIVTATPKPVATATATPTAVPSTAIETFPLVSGQPIELTPIGGYKLGLLIDSAPGTTFPSNAKISVGAYLGLPSGAPQPQVRRRFVTGADVLASIGLSFNVSASILYTVTASIPGSTTGESYTAETYDETTGKLIATVVAETAADGTTTFSDPTAISVVAGDQYVTELFVSPTAATPTPTSPPTPSPSETPTTAPSAPALAVFAANNPGGGIAEYNAATGGLYQTFGSGIAASTVSVDSAGHAYIFGNGLISELSIGATSISKNYSPTSTTPLSFSVAPGGEMVVAGLTGTNVVFDEWDANAAGAPSRTVSYPEPSGPELSYALGPDGKLYVPYAVSGIQKFDVILPGSITVTKTFTETLASKSLAFSPNVMAATSAGALYVGEWSFQSTDTNAGMYVFTASGAESKVKSMDPGIQGIDFDSVGNVYVASNNAVANGSASQTDDTAEQLSVYSAGGVSLKQQIDDGAPGVGALTVGSNGTAYLVQYESFGANAPASSGAVYSVAPGASASTDLIPTVDTNNVVLFDGTTARDVRTNAVYRASLSAMSNPAIRAGQMRRK